MAENPAASLTPSQAAEAVRLGLLLNVIYGMYGDHPGDTAPPLSADLPGGYKFLAWVQMRDYVFASGEWSFYGIIAQSPDGTETVVAIRGTESPVEWWDDLISAVPAPWGGPGRVGFGFNQIYRTLRVVQKSEKAMTAEAPRSKPPAPFAQQVADLVRTSSSSRAARPNEVAAEVPKPHTVKVVGHSLGSALATLYVAENVRVGQVHTPLLCTFASPRVGDPEFAAAFDALAGLESWRIVNQLDAVPKVPFLGFEHIKDLYEYNPGPSVKPGLECWHSLDTYLHLLDPSQPIEPGCVRQNAARSALLATHPTVALSATKSATVTITINVEPGS